MTTPEEAAIETNQSQQRDTVAQARQREMRAKAKAIRFKAQAKADRIRSKADAKAEHKLAKAEAKAAKLEGVSVPQIAKKVRLDVHGRPKPLMRGWLHAFASPLSLAAGIVLICLAHGTGLKWACAVFMTCSLVLFTNSAVYHLGDWSPKVTNVLRRIDHVNIFLLIAGTYTPITLVSLRGPWGWSLFAVIWGLALAGIVMETTRLRRFRAVLIGLYVVMGWSVVAAVKPMLANVEPGGLWLLLAGGLAYTGGIGFYLWRRLPYNHAIWHLFVLAGSILHYFAVLFYIIPVMAD